MGCGGSHPVPPPGAGTGTLTIYGDYFSSDTRTLLCLVYIAGVPHQFNEIDTFQGDHKKDSYTLINPTQQIPMITEGNFKILGGSQLSVLYLCNSNKRIGDKLYQKENRATIDKHMAWFLSRMKPTSSKLARMMV